MPAEISIETIADAEAYLRERPNFERTFRTRDLEATFKLERMHELCALLGHPEVQVPAIHVAGTKGKGSTSTMLAAMLQAAGYRTGLYTSPHLCDVRERIVIDGTPVSPTTFLQLLRQVQPAVRQLDQQLTPAGPTYFEVLTAAALVHFVAASVQVAVLEVGLGGRLDSTNVCHPECCVITNISLDHTRQLGRTLAAIAREKAGILKPNVPVVSGATARTAGQVIEQVARETGCDLVTLNRDFSYRSHIHPGSGDSPDGAVRWCMDYEGVDGANHRNLELRMPGRHQHANAAVALATCEILRCRGWSLDSDACRSGLASAWAPARLQVVRHDPLTIVDTAHNQASMAATVQGLKDCWPRQRLIFVLATTRGKDISAILQHLMPMARCLILTRYSSNPRANRVEKMAEVAERICRTDARARNCRVLSQPDPTAAVHLAFQEATQDDLVCVTGSFSLAAEVLTGLQPNPSDRSAGLVARS
jgi:dihydrofolate synthase/folylpolyglutamate synthase